MASTGIEDEAPQPPSAARRIRAFFTRRTFRLYSGLVLFVFLSMHLANHAAGVFGPQALDLVQTLRWKIWMNPFGTALLYAAFAIHIALGLWRIGSRSTLRLRADEAIQIALGVLIPILLLPHLLETRVAGTWFGGTGYYAEVLDRIWPERAGLQILLVLVAWGHGVLGIHMAFRHRRWYPKFHYPGLALAVALAALSIAGFIAGAREAEIRRTEPPELSASATAGLSVIATQGYLAIGGVFLLLGASMAFGGLRRRIGRQISIAYRGHGPVMVAQCASVLEASRIHDIPHPALCRGKGRCGTCRVQILDAGEDLPEPSALERATLERIGAPAQVRLACQLRPGRDVGVRILLPVLGRSNDPETLDEAQHWAAERLATLLTLDLRAFNRLTGGHLPYELGALVNRFSNEMRQAIEQHGGRVSTFHGDGLVAVFEGGAEADSGAVEALRAARDMTRVIKILNREMGGALPIPIRAGIGIHTDRVVIARIGQRERGAQLMAFGVGVNVASALERACREVLSDCLVSEVALRSAGLDGRGLDRHEISVDGIDAEIAAFAINDWRFVKRRLFGSKTAANSDSEAKTAGE